jgi:hypothetical protein
MACVKGMEMTQIQLESALRRGAKFLLVGGISAILSLAGCKKKEKYESAEATKPAAQSTSEEAHRPALPPERSEPVKLNPEYGPPAPGSSGASASGNLIRDPEFRNWEKNWQVAYTPPTRKSKATVEEVELPNGEKANALKITTDQSAELHLKTPIPASPAARYEFSIWAKQDPSPVGQRFFGLYTYDAKGQKIGVFNLSNVRTPPHQHFIRFNYQDGMWRQFTGTLLPNSAKQTDFARKLSEGQGNSFRSALDMQSLNLFFLNYYNNGKSVATWVALPAITEIK